MITNPLRLLRKFVNKTFFIFSCILFLIIALSAVVAYSISAHQINISFIEQQLSVASETMRLRLATTVNSELALVLKMADTPVIRQYFKNPNDSVIREQANTELNLYQEHFENKVVFWINDVDKIFYSTGNAPYVLDPDDPASYWYKLTLYETEKFNLNINYNPDLDQINLWVNVPVFDDINGLKKPIGMLGIGINLTDFSNFIATSYHNFDANITPYMFNKYNEITSAVDYELVENKVHLDALLGDTGRELIRVARDLSEGESRSFIYDNKIYNVNAIQAVEWYLALSYPMPGFLALNNAMNTVFFGMLTLIFFMFVVINIFIARLEHAMAENNLQLIEANRKAEAASHAKSDFLAKMSHEIRTPMNAITGMAELLLREELSREAQGYAQDIKQAGNNLVTIINDILDFSKIEAGKLEIIQGNYLLSSLINDTVNIIRMRLIDKPIRFFTNIDGTIPNSLIGDEIRIRQILLNLLSNAVKYSEKGHIGLTITVDKRDDKCVWLRIAVSDTGKGIRPEDKVKLFGEFVKVDVRRNLGIEGTGLGLAITKNLCEAMGGEISLESEYGKGSVFTALIPQGIESDTPFAMVEDPGKKKVLVYDGRINYAKSVCWTLENMKIPYAMVTDPDVFASALYREEWFYVFSSYGLYEKIKPLMEKEDAAFKGGKKPPLALMVEWGTEALIPGVRFVSIPVQALSVANVLNGKEDSKSFIKNSGVIRFTFPSARILVVDDIATNLKVAEGLLAPYKAEVDTCLNGLQSIEMIKHAAFQKRGYDIVFMDHMMPKMDGIEATSLIRALDGAGFRSMPIIALTANAVVGMREMFIENGFNDFLSKPIDVSKLDEILDRWIPEEKKDHADHGGPPPVHPDGGQHPNSQHQAHDPKLFDIPGLDTAKGIAATGGTLSAYLQVLSMFSKDVQNRMMFLAREPDEENMLELITQVHALKSASASIGAQEISSMAAGLEAVGKAGDLVFIRESLPGFVEKLIELISNINVALEIMDPKKQIHPDAAFISSHSALFNELSEALKSQKIADIKNILNQLKQSPAEDAGVKEILGQISDQVLMSEFDNALKIVEDLLSGVKA